MRFPSLGWRNRTAHSWAWFGFGVFASWTGSLWISTAFATPPDRWNSVEGVVAGGFGAALIASVMTAIFAAWLAWRQRESDPSYPLMLVVLGLGLIHPLVCILPLAGLDQLSGHHPAVAYLVPIAVFGSPILMAEGALQFAE